MWTRLAHVMHGSVHPCEVGAPCGPRVARDGVREQQLLDHDIIRLAGCVPQPPDSVPPHMVSHVGLASAGQQLSGGGAVWATVEAQHLPQAAIVEVSKTHKTPLHRTGAAAAPGICRT